MNAPDLLLEQRLGIDIICIINVCGSLQEDNCDMNPSDIDFAVTEVYRIYIILFNSYAKN